MLNFDNLKQSAVAAVGAVLLTATTVVASVGPARIAETTPVHVAQIDGALHA